MLRPTRLSELTPMIFDTELTHLGSEASIYFCLYKQENTAELGLKSIKLNDTFKQFILIFFNLDLRLTLKRRC